MDLELRIENGAMHHAYALCGKREMILPELRVFFESELGIRVRGNPDVWVGEFETLGIEEGKMLKEFHQTKPVGGNRRFFIVAFDFVTNEAQNSLLKMFEEPSSSSHFFLIVPREEIFLPTLRSRLSVIDVAGKPDKNSVELAKAFLARNTTERSFLLKKIIEEKDRVEAINFLNALEKEIYEGLDFSKPNSGKTFALNEIIHSRKYLGDRSPSVKMILEHLAGVIEQQVEVARDRK